MRKPKEINNNPDQERNELNEIDGPSEDEDEVVQIKGGGSGSGKDTDKKNAISIQDDSSATKSTILFDDCDDPFADNLDLRKRMKENKNGQKVLKLRQDLLIKGIKRPIGLAVLPTNGNIVISSSEDGTVKM